MHRCWGLWQSIQSNDLSRWKGVIWSCCKNTASVAVGRSLRSEIRGAYLLDAWSYQHSPVLIWSFRVFTFIRMLGLIVEGPNDQGIALEFCSGGALNQWLKQHKERLHLQQSIQWCLQIGKGMEYLHKRAPASFLHRDLKSSNILLLYSGATCPSKQGLFNALSFVEMLTKI